MDLDIRKAILCAARGTGKTIAVACLVMWFEIVVWYFMDREKVDTIILSGSQKQSDMLYSYCEDIVYRNKWVLEREIIAVQREVMKLKSGVIMPLPASYKAAEGQHRDLLILDECGRLDTKFIATTFSINKTSPIGRTVLLSTPYEYFSMFVGIWEKPEPLGFVKFGIWKTMDAHWISAQDISDARAMVDAGLMSEEDWEINWLGNPYTLQGGMFPHGDLRACLVDEKPTEIGPGTVHMGVDWGFKAGTATVIVEKQGNEVIIHYAILRREERFEDIQDEIAALKKQYNVIEIFCDSSHEGQNQLLESRGMPVTRIKFVRDKSGMQHRLRALVEKHLLAIPREYQQLIQQMKHYSKDTKDKDDLVDALMLACFEVSGIESVWKHRSSLTDSYEEEGWEQLDGVSED